MIDREFQEMLASISKFLGSNETVRVNCSLSFPARAICKECGSPPTFYYRQRKKIPKQDVRDAMQVSLGKYIKPGHLLSSWYFEYDPDPKTMNQLSEFAFTLEGKSFKPARHQNRFGGVKAENFYIDLLECNCSATVWAFQQTGSQKRPEIVHRQARSAYPKKFSW